MFIIAHADHPEFFCLGILVGVALALAHVFIRYFNNRR